MTNAHPGTAIQATQKPRSVVNMLGNYVGTDPLALIGMLLLVVVVGLAVFGPFITPLDPLETTRNTFSPPSPSNPFGTDQFGRDILSRVMASFQIDLAIALIAVSGALFFGIAIGSVSAYVGGRFDDIVMRVIDVIQTFPMLILAMTIVSFLGSGMINVVIVTIIINIPIFARLVRGDILSKKYLEYVDAARCSGCTGPRILFRHLLPNALGPLIVQGSLNLAWAMLNIAALSFLGIGITPPTPDLGIMIADGANYLSNGAWWMSVFPGIALVLAIFAFNLLGDGLQDRLDPRREVR